MPDAMPQEARPTHPGCEVSARAPRGQWGVEGRGPQGTATPPPPCIGLIETRAQESTHCVAPTSLPRPPHPTSPAKPLAAPTGKGRGRGRFGYMGWAGRACRGLGTLGGGSRCKHVAHFFLGRTSWSRTHPGCAENLDGAHPPPPFSPLPPPLTGIFQEWGLS